jgi:hypothetical protein
MFFFLFLDFEEEDMFDDVYDVYDVYDGCDFWTWTRVDWTDV